MRTPLPLVSVIIPTWNRRDLLGECLRGLKGQTYERFEVIVVDNGSSDGSLDEARAIWGEQGLYLRNDRNLGYARAVNQGFEASGSDYVATLNNDAVPEPGWLAALVEAAEASPEVGMVASKIVDHDDPHVIDGTGLLIYPDGSSRARGRLERDEGQYDDVTEALLPSGAAALYRRRMLQEIGHHDENFFAYCEDTDLGLRGRLAGWKCAFAPKAVVRHRYSASTGGYSESKAFLVERNRLWVAVKNFPVGRLLLTPFYTLDRYAFQAWAALSGRGAAGRFARENSSGRLMVLLLRAQWAGLRGLPRALRARRQVRVAVPPEEIARWFREFGIEARELAFKE
ncbi:MAG: glycosyltransferase family 2 protein [Deltaproteobacteria bacterium]|nr:glycosyltransferase family 2 protein [Deltaproteobacteria bacterium]